MAASKYPMVEMDEALATVLEQTEPPSRSRFRRRRRTRTARARAERGRRRAAASAALSAPCSRATRRRGAAPAVRGLDHGRAAVAGAGHGGGGAELRGAGRVLAGSSRSRRARRVRVHHDGRCRPPAPTRSRSSRTARRWGAPPARARAVAPGKDAGPADATSLPRGAARSRRALGAGGCARRLGRHARVRARAPPVVGVLDGRRALAEPSAAGDGAQQPAATAAIHDANRAALLAMLGGGDGGALLAARDFGIVRDSAEPEAARRREAGRRRARRRRGPRRARRGSCSRYVSTGEADPSRRRSRGRRRRRALRRLT